MQGEGKSHEQGMKVRKDVIKSQHSQRKAAGPLFMTPPGKTKQNKTKKRVLKNPIVFTTGHESPFLLYNL